MPRTPIGCLPGYCWPFDFLGRLQETDAESQRPPAPRLLISVTTNRLNSRFAERVPGTSAVATRGEGSDSSHADGAYSSTDGGLPGVVTAG